MRILLVEDKPTRALRLQKALRQEEFKVDIASDAGQALLQFEHRSYDVVLLDFALRSAAAPSLLKKLRRKVSTPVLALNVRPRDRVPALRMGADDCLTSPFSLQELIARIEALIRRSSRLLESLSVGSLQLDHVRRRALVHGQAVDLSLKEYELLECLMQNAGQVVTREMVLGVWNLSSGMLSNIVDVYVSHLRAKINARLGSTRIKTIRGRGYMLVDSPKSDEARTAARPTKP